MLKKIRIKNYKNLRDTEIELRPVNLIVGPNPSGKTALWEAMHRFSRLFRGQEGYDRLWGDYEDVVSDRDTRITITFGCDVETDEEEISYSLKLRKDTIEEETLVIGGETLFHAWWDKGNLVLHIKGKRPIVIANRPWRWVEPYLAGAVKSISGEEWANKLRSVGDLFGIDRWGLFRFFKIMDIGKPENMRMDVRGEGLDFDGVNIARLLWELKDKEDATLPEIRDIFEELTGGNLSVGAHVDVKIISFSLVYRKHSLHLEDWPDGWKQTLLLLTALKTSKNLVFIEEPETHLHPDLFRFLRGQIEEAADRGLQLILSTHNLSFVNHFKFDEVILVEDGKFRKPKKEKWFEECALSLGEIITTSLVEEDEE